jgi:nitrate reductase NapAB chaperone NapD
MEKNNKKAKTATAFSLVFLLIMYKNMSLSSIPHAMLIIQKIPLKKSRGQGSVVVVMAGI